MPTLSVAIIARSIRPKLAQLLVDAVSLLVSKLLLLVGVLLGLKKRAN
jgi:hypothetical protein